MAIDCIADLRDRLFKGGYDIRSPFITSSQTAAWDSLCPFPQCAYGYTYDPTYSIAPNGSVVLTAELRVQWTPQTIPYITPDPTDCIIRSPDVLQGLQYVNCSDLSQIECLIPLDSYLLSSKRGYNAQQQAPYLGAYPAQYAQVPCSDLNQYNCQYLVTKGYNSQTQLASAPCNDVYITNPSDKRKSSIPKEHFSTQTRQDNQATVSEGVCVRYLGAQSNPAWIYHFPYTSMLHCLADIPRSTSKWCTYLFQNSYFECKLAAGLVNGA